MSVSPQAVIDFLRINSPDTLQSAEKVRKFIKKHYPSLDLVTVDTLCRYARRHKNTPTAFEEAWSNKIVTFKNEV